MLVEQLVSSQERRTYFPIKVANLPRN